MYMMARTTFDGEHYLHRVLWLVVERQLDHALEKPRGAMHDDLVALVFSFHALEGYLNYVGSHLAPEIWKDERNFFRTDPYHGFSGKLRKVLELVGVSEPDRNVRPYSTVWLLKGIRDLIAHAKVERFAYTIEHAVDSDPPFPATSLDEVITRENALRGRDDVSAFAEMIHAAARPKIADARFGPHPFKGVTLHGDRSSTRMNKR